MRITEIVSYMFGFLFGLFERMLRSLFPKQLSTIASNPTQPTHEDESIVIDSSISQPTVQDSYCLKDIQNAKTLLEESEYQNFSDYAFDKKLFQTITSKFNNLIHLTICLDVLYTEVSKFIEHGEIDVLDLESPKITLYGVSDKSVSLARFIELDDIDINLPSTLLTTAQTLYTYFTRYEEMYAVLQLYPEFDDTVGNYYERRVRVLTKELHTFTKTLCEIGQLHD